MAEPLSQSITFSALAARVATLETNGAPVNGAGIVAALGYTPANQAGDSFGGSITAPAVLARYGGEGYITTTSGGGPDYTGYTEFWASNGVRQGYIGFCHLLNDAIRYVSESGGGHAFTGGPLAINQDTGAHIELYGSDSPIMRGRNSVGDQIGYLQWDSASGAAILEAGVSVKLAPLGASELVATAGSGVFVVHDLTVIDSNLGLSIPTANAPRLTMGGNSWLQFDRIALGYSFVIGGSSAFNVTATGITANGLTAPTLSVDANYFAQLSGSNPVLNFDANDYLKYDRGANQLSVTIGGTTALELQSNGVVNVKGDQIYVHDTIFCLSYNSGSPIIQFDTGGDWFGYNRSTNDFFFKVAGTTQMGLDASGNLTPRGYVSPANDPNFLLQVSGGSPRVQFDANDYVTYDRTNNRYQFKIGGNIKFTIGADHKGTIWLGDTTGSWNINVQTSLDGDDRLVFTEPGGSNVFGVDNAGNIIFSGTTYPGADPLAHL